MLTAYENAVINLIQAPSSPTPLIATATLDSYINTARSQVAIEGECIRNNGLLTIGTSTQIYGFSLITTVGGFTPLGILGPVTVRLASYTIPNTSNRQRLYARPWPWFDLYELSNPTVVAGVPRVYSQYGQGSTDGSLYVSLVDQIYTLNLDLTCLPIALVNDSTGEAIPYPWTDAVPFYAAWLALLQLQRPADADEMLQRYSQLMARARRGVTPSVLPANFEQQTDPTLANKLGSQPFRSGTDIGAGAQGGRTLPASR